MKVAYQVRCLAPLDKRIDEFLAACDLGVSGVLVPRQYRVTGTLKDGETVATAGGKLRAAFESAGCAEVSVAPEAERAVNS